MNHPFWLELKYMRLLNSIIRAIDKNSMVNHLISDNLVKLDVTKKAAVDSIDCCFITLTLASKSQSYYFEDCFLSAFNR